MSPIRINLYQERGTRQPPGRAEQAKKKIEKTLEDGYKKTKETASAFGYWTVKEGKVFSGALKEKTEKFIAKHLRGELTGDEKEWKDKTRSEAAVDVGKGALEAGLSAAASIYGVKSLVDIPRWGFQKYYTSGERKFLVEAFKEFDTEKHKSPLEGRVDAVIEHKRKELKARIETSNYLTKEQKQALFQRLEKTTEAYRTEKKKAEKKRAQEAGKILEEYIHARIETSTVIKETLNTALVVSGFALARVGVYGAIASVERYKKVKKEKEQGMRKQEFFFDEFIKGAFLETFRDLTFQKQMWEKNKKVRGLERAARFTKGLSTLARITGITGTAFTGIDEGLSTLAHLTDKVDTNTDNVDEGFITQATDKLLKIWENKSDIAHSAIKNFESNADRASDLSKKIWHGATGVYDLGKETVFGQKTVEIGDIPVSAPETGGETTPQDILNPERVSLPYGEISFIYDEKGNVTMIIPPHNATLTPEDTQRAMKLLESTWNKNSSILSAEQAKNFTQEIIHDTKKFHVLLAAYERLQEQGQGSTKAAEHLRGLLEQEIRVKEDYYGNLFDKNNPRIRALLSKKT